MEQKEKLLGWMRRTSVMVAVALLAGVAAKPTTAQTGAVATKTPVVVELFTSEGCSDCPPADRLLTALQQNPNIAGVQVIALEEHVDYWNSRSWEDPFSSHSFSTRQSDYSTHFGLDSVYTPQMVVDGSSQFVGSDRSQALQSIASAARTPQATVHIERSTSTFDTVLFHIRVSPVPSLSAGDTAEVILAVTEGGLTSHVSGGENGGSTLSHSAVVRQMRKIGDAGAQPVAFNANVSAANGWKRANLHAVVFIQERVSHRIFGAATVSLA